MKMVDLLISFIVLFFVIGIPCILFLGEYNAAPNGFMGSLAITSSVAYLVFMVLLSALVFISFVGWKNIVNHIAGAIGWSFLGIFLQFPLLPFYFLATVPQGFVALPLFMDSFADDSELRTLLKPLILFSICFIILIIYMFIIYGVYSFPFSKIFPKLFSDESNEKGDIFVYSCVLVPVLLIGLGINYALLRWAIRNIDPNIYIRLYGETANKILSFAAGNS